MFAIRYATATTWLGKVIIATTSRGLCGLELGDDATELVARLRQRHRFAQLSPGRDPLGERALACLEAGGATPGWHDVPLDLRGTPFQSLVWHALRAIAAGSTVTYSELAERIARPRAIRAVARACGENPVAVAIPCHRVLRKTGALGGYRWGLDRKRALLDREGVTLLGRNVA